MQQRPENKNVFSRNDTTIDGGWFECYLYKLYKAKTLIFFVRFSNQFRDLSVMTSQGI